MSAVQLEEKEGKQGVYQHRVTVTSMVDVMTLFHVLNLNLQYGWNILECKVQSSNPASFQVNSQVSQEHLLYYPFFLHGFEMSSDPILNSYICLLILIPNNSTYFFLFFSASIILS